MIALLRRRKAVDADLIPVSPALPVLEDGRYVWPVPRQIRNETYPAGSLFFTEGDCITCPRCGLGNSTIAPFCIACRAVLPLGSLNREPVPA